MKTLPFLAFTLLLSQFATGQTEKEQEPDTCIITAPNSISPNDEVKEYMVFRVSSTCTVHSFEFTVYNRWGQALFSTEDIHEGWDASKQKAEVYVWQVSGKFPDGGKVEQQGSVTVIR